MALEDDELNKRREERRQEQRFLAKQQKWLKIGLIVTAATMILCAAALLITQGLVRLPDSGDPDLESTTPVTTVPPTTKEPAPTEPDTVIHFVAGGDLNITDKTVASGTAVSGYDYTEVFMDVVPVLAGADLTALNFEGGTFGTPYGTERRSAPQQMLQALRNAGVDLIQSANSQSIADGIRGLKDTLQSIRAAGMEPVGSYADPEEFQKSGGYILREINGIRVAIVAFTKGMDGMGLPAGSEDCVNLLYTDYSSTYQKVDTEGIKAVLQAAEKSNPDITIALLHWGSEFNNQISTTQEKITKLMLEQGVDAIIGTHSHYVQKAVFDPAAGTLVAYSLGDFFGDADKAGTDYSVLLDLEITKSGVTGETTITGFDYTPIYTVDETATGGGMRILRIREAMDAYENSCLGRVSEEVYNAMSTALTKIDSRMEQEQEQETE